MEYQHEPLDNATLFALLRGRGLIIDDVVACEQFLSHVNYFRVASYLRPMEGDKVTHQFKPGSTFSQAITLYSFDVALRALIFTALQRIEVSLRSKMVNLFSLKYGAYWFLDERLILDTRLYRENLSHLTREVNRSHEDFIVKYYDRYDKPPFPPCWQTFEVISFGTLSKLFCNFADIRLKKTIAHEYFLPNHKVLESWLECCVALRNYVAHHVRVWNRKYPLKPMLALTLQRPWITILPDVNRTYAQLCYVTYLVNSIDPTNTFSTKLQDLLATFPSADRRALGFPDGWEQEALWQGGVSFPS